jgi:Fe-S cluster biogenesis protein NfuA
MLVSFCLEIVQTLTQHSYTVYAKCTIGSEIVLDALDGTCRSCGSSGSSIESIWRKC